MQTYYEIEPMSGIICPAGQDTVIRVPFPGRSLITKLVIAQIGGIAAAFSAEMFNNEVLDAAPLSASDSEGEDTGIIPDECWAIAPLMNSDANGLLKYFNAAGELYGFYSHTKTPEQEIGRDRNLFIRIRPSGSGDKEYCLIVGGLIAAP